MPTSFEPLARDSRASIGRARLPRTRNMAAGANLPGCASKSGKLYCHSGLYDDLDILPDDISDSEKSLQISDKRELVFVFGRLHHPLTSKFVNDARNVFLAKTVNLDLRTDHRSADSA